MVYYFYEIMKIRLHRRGTYLVMFVVPEHSLLTQLYGHLLLGTFSKLSHYEVQKG